MIIKFILIFYFQHVSKISWGHMSKGKNFSNEIYSVHKLLSHILFCKDSSISIPEKSCFSLWICNSLVRRNFFEVFFFLKESFRNREWLKSVQTQDFFKFCYCFHERKRKCLVNKCCNWLHYILKKCSNKVIKSPLLMINIKALKWNN